MKSKTTEQFREFLSKLPASVQQQAHDAYEMFRMDPFHPSLHFKQVEDSDPPLYSVRVGRSYRAIGYRKRDAVPWVWIGNHAEYDRRIRR